MEAAGLYYKHSTSPSQSYVYFNIGDILFVGVKEGTSIFVTGFHKVYLKDVL